MAAQSTPAPHRAVAHALHAHTSKPWRAHALVTLLYLGLTLIMTWPLAARLSTSVPGGGVDEGAFVWNFWWIKHALLDLHTSPLQTDVIFYPLGANLALYTLALLNGLLGLPLTVACGPIVAANVLLLAGFVLAGYGAFLLARDALGSAGRAETAAAFVAGLVYAFASSRFLYAALGQYNFASIHWLPWAALCLLRLWRRPGPRPALLAGVFAALAVLTEMTFAVYLFIFGLVYIAWRLRRRQSLVGDAPRRPVWLALALAVFLIGSAPVLLPVVQETLRSGDYLVRGWGGADRFLIDLLGPLVPSPLHPLWGQWASRAAGRFADINFGFAGYLALGLTLVGAWLARRGKDGLWSVLALVFFVLALGPLLHINGLFDFDIDGLIVNLPLPYVIIHYLPFFKAARVPGRFGIMATLAAAVLVALAVHRLLQWAGRPRLQLALAGIISAAILFENAALPLPLAYAAPPVPYAHIGRESDDFAIVQLPLGWRYGFGTLGEEHTMLQSYQWQHGKRLLSGNTSRLPAGTFDYFAQAPLLRSLIALEEGRPVDTATRESDRALAAATAQFYDIRYVVVQSPALDSPAEAYLHQMLPLQLVDEGSEQAESAYWHFGADGKRAEERLDTLDWRLYRVAPGAAVLDGDIDVGTPGARLHLASGWSRDETVAGRTAAWVTEREARLLVRLAAPQNSALTLTAVPFGYAGAPVQQMSVLVNGRPAGTVTLGSGWQDYTLPLPAASLRAGINDIRLRFSSLASPAQVGEGSDARTLAAAVDRLQLELR